MTALTKAEKTALIVCAIIIGGILLSSPYAGRKSSKSEIALPYYHADSLEALHWVRPAFVDSVRRGRLDTVIVPFRRLYVQYADSLGWDWRMLAALSFQESKFDMGALSKRGAVGLMQIMPSTARHLGIDDISDPEQNIKAAFRLLKSLKRSFRAIDFGPEEKFKLIVAAYNSGIVPINKCIDVCRQSGKEPSCWEDVASAIPAVEDFKGVETLAHVEKVSSLYEMFKKIK